jgi:hypothetical protein
METVEELRLHYEKMKEKSEAQTYRMVRAYLYNTLILYKTIAVNEAPAAAENRLNEIQREDFQKLFEEIYLKVGLFFYQDQKNRLEQYKNKDTPNVDFFSLIWRQIVVNATSTLEIASLITRVTENTKTMIRALLVKAAAERMAPRDIAKLFNAEKVIFAKSRALTIARTEVGRAASIGIEQAAKDSQLELLTVWHHSAIGNYRENHRPLNGKYVKKGEVFKVGDVTMKYPHDPSGGASEVINCRCTHSYVTRRSAEALGIERS